jgi:Mn2+/Fe2+ NRAMP family transporter
VRTKGDKKMGISRRDMLINVAVWAIGMIIILLIAYDPLDILDLTQKVIIVVVMSIVLLPLLLIWRQRLLKKMKKTNLISTHFSFFSNVFYY